ncbi:hypothetical protein [Pseudalkalibacillus hwajinpoensis]|uniref:hypothetical protein n=1 Tax=Guptibacillus hwajinpoensis TaxID=208199 RepID=UPI002AA5D8D6
MENYEGNLRYQPYMSVSFSFERMIYSFKSGLYDETDVHLRLRVTLTMLASSVQGSIEVDSSRSLVP